MAHSYSHLYNIPTTGLRFFTVYGPWGRPDMALFVFTKAILNGKPIKCLMRVRCSAILPISTISYRALFEYWTSRLHQMSTGRATSLTPQVRKHLTEVYNIGNNKPAELIEFIEAIEMELVRREQGIFANAGRRCACNKCRHYRI